MTGVDGFDSFAYRHRVADLMASPVVTIGRECTLRQAAVRLTEHRIGALVVTDAAGRLCGIVTERDLVRAVATGVELASASVASAMTADVATIAPDAFAFVAIGRMQRLGVRHLPVIAEGRLVGIVSARNLLRLRSDAAPAIGDAIAVATGAADMAASLAELPCLAARLLADGCTGHEVAAVISGVFRDATRRAAELAEAALCDRGLGPPPARHALLILGSGGRGESLLRPDQDNAVVHDGDAADDAWFAAFGRAASDLLNAAGIPYCQGGVMASEPQWRRPLDEWHREIGRWIARGEGESLLNIDIFFDFRPVHGDQALARSLREPALELAARSPLFLRLLAAEVEGLGSPFGLFGRLRRGSDGRVDAKMAGLLPAVGAARVMALACRVAETATPARLRAVAEAGAIDSEAAEDLIRAHGVVLSRMLAQQVADRAANLPPGNRVAPDALAPPQRRAFVEALQTIRQAPLLVRDTLTAPRHA